MALVYTTRHSGAINLDVNMSFTKVRLNEDSKTPLYHQMSEQIYSDIESRRLKPGDPLPSERELCETYGVSRGTVRQAIQALANLGYITRKQGKGTIIKPYPST